MENLPSKTITRRGDVRPVDVETDLAIQRDRVTTKPPGGRRESPGIGRMVLAALLQLGLVLAIAFGGYVGYQRILESAPVAQRKERERVARLVDVETVRAATQGPVIEAWGEVQAARTLIVRAELTATVTWIDPEITEGGRLTKGQLAARLDDRDFKLAVGQAEADIAEIKARIMIERGQGDIGKRDLSRRGSNITAAQRALILREPQMNQLEAELAAAEAALEQARNALAKTEVRAPFDAVVISQSVAPGSMLPQGTEAAQLVASDRFNVTIAVPSGALDWIDLDAAQLVRITQRGIWSGGQERFGTLVRLSSTLTETGRMAELIAEVQDPLALKPENAGKPPLLLGSFVNVQLMGRAIEGAVSLNRAYLRDNDTVWVMTPDDKLEVREVDVAWRGAETVLVRNGLSDGERIVTTTLNAISPGMAVRTRPEVSG